MSPVVESHSAALGNLATAEGRHLLGGERFVGELGPQVVRAEQVDDVVHPLRQLRPLARSAVVGCRRDGLKAREQLHEVVVSRLSELLRVGVGEVSPEREHAAGEGEDHERLGDHLPRDAARLTLARATPRRR